jgi:hypothetical protein
VAAGVVLFVAIVKKYGRTALSSLMIGPGLGLDDWILVSFLSTF